MKYQQIQALIGHFEQFEAENGSEDLYEFGTWLQQKQLATNQQPPRFPYPGWEEDQIVRALGTLANFAKHYVKKAIKESPLVGWNDLVAMIVLYHGGSMRKTELIQRSVVELSPGIEVIKRLLRLGLIEEFPDPNDRRAKQVLLTQAGRKLYEQLQGQIRKVSQIVSGNLEQEEKSQLLPLLEKLVHFHFPIWQDDQSAALEQLVQTYISDSPR